MFNVFLYAFNAVMPILLLLLLGYALRRVGFAGEEFFKKANALVFHVFLPLLLFCNVYDIDSLSDVHWGDVGYIAFVVVLLAVIGLVLARFFIPERLQKGPFIQCVFRSNCAILGIPLAEALGGAQGVAFAAVATAVTIPLFNTLAVIILSYYADKKPSVKATVVRTLKNPLILGVAAGLLVLAVRSQIPIGSDGAPVFLLERNCVFLFSAVRMAAQAASPLALVVLGARFDFSAVRSLLRQIALGTFCRIVLAPALAIGGAIALTQLGVLQFTPTEFPALVAVFGSPIAVSSAVMVGEIGGDDQLAAQLVVWTSAFSLFTIFITVFLLRSFSYL